MSGAKKRTLGTKQNNPRFLNKTGVYGRHRNNSQWSTDRVQLGPKFRTKQGSVQLDQKIPFYEILIFSISFVELDFFRLLLAHWLIQCWTDPSHRSHFPNDYESLPGYPSSI